MVEAAESPENTVYLQQSAWLYVSEDSNIFIKKNEIYFLLYHVK